MSTMGREADELARVRRERERRSNGGGSTCRCSFCGGSFPAEKMKGLGWFDHERGAYRHELICSGAKCRKEAETKVGYGDGRSQSSAAEAAQGLP